MVAYSFKRRFIVPIKIGLGLPILPGDEDPDAASMLRPKRQTIRAIGKKRHARENDALQLYTAMRTKQCRKIGDARCTSAESILIKVCEDADLHIRIAGKNLSDRKAEEFAYNDGFGSIEDMWLFWHREHAGVVNFGGVLVLWEAST